MGVKFSSFYREKKTVHLYDFNITVTSVNFERSNEFKIIEKKL